MFNLRNLNDMAKNDLEIKEGSYYLVSYSFTNEVSKYYIKNYFINNINFN